MIFTKLKEKTIRLKNDVYAIYLAYKHPDTPWYAKLFSIIIVSYAFSPIDLIPDFIPILGYLDDLILIPLGITIAIKIIPRKVLDECREKAKLEKNTKKKNWFAGIIIISIWIIILLFIVKGIIALTKKQVALRTTTACRLRRIRPSAPLAQRC
jgi:uncharacterized membrane protein YkvA (DUF1232 family)